MIFIFVPQIELVVNCLGLAPAQGQNCKTNLYMMFLTTSPSFMM